MSFGPLASQNRLRVAEFVRLAGEAVLLFLAAFAPWPFASVETEWRMLLLGGISLLTLLWFVHVVLTRSPVVHLDAVSLGMLGLLLFGAFQMVPLPESVMGLLSPKRLEYHQTLRPPVDEQLPGESLTSSRSSWLPLTLDQSRSRDWVAQFSAVFVVYLVARNFLANRDGFRRFAWVAFINGVLLSILALGQFFSSPHNTVFWSVRTSGQVFGPFVCKNHYPYYVAMCAGLGIGLLLQEWERLKHEHKFYIIPGLGLRGWFFSLQVRMKTPRSVLLFAGIVLMLVSIPFSLSRGGALALLLASGLTVLVVRFKARRENRTGAHQTAGGVAAVFLVLTAVGFGGWLGWSPVEKRLQTIGESDGMDDRLPLWKDLWGAAKRFPLVGTGAGTLLPVEQTARTRPDPRSIEFLHAHNDYLEALIEGGLVRLGLTVLIVGSLLGLAARSYLHNSHRTAAPLLLGGFFGLADVSFHSLGDFGMTIPAVAIMAATLAAFMMGTIDDFKKPPPRRRRGESLERSPVAPQTTLEKARTVLTAASALMVACLLILEESRVQQIERWRNAARYIYADETDPSHLERAALCLEMALRLRPDDAALWNDLSAMKLSAALEKIQRACAAATGAGVFVLRPEASPPAIPSTDLHDSLDAARRARNLCPILPGPHIRLGSLTPLFERADSSAVYFERARKVAPGDSEVWFLSGVEALARGDRESTWQFWRKAIELAPEELPRVIPCAKRYLSPEDLRIQVLPDSPSIWIDAAQLVFGDDPSRQVDRRVYLREAEERWTLGPQPSKAREWILWGGALEEMGNATKARSIYQNAFKLFPESDEICDRLARSLEADEQYEVAIPLLERLARRYPLREDVHDRLDAIHHAMTLSDEIDGR